MKITKFILSAAVIILLGAGCAKAPITQKNSNANTPPPIGTSRSVPASSAFTVAISSDGEFDPVTAFVAKGTALTFVNNSSKPHSIVPTIDAGKKFDALASKTEIAPGDKFTVMMDRVGRWLYNDGTNAAFGGAVEVAE